MTRLAPEAPAWQARSMNLDDERVRERLLVNGPVGTWKTLPGSHLLLFADTIRFDADGSGELCLHSALRGEQRLRLRWAVAGYGKIACQVIYDDPLTGPDGAIEEDDWSHIAFVFERQTSDSGNYWVMKQPGRDGFWELALPVVPE